MELEVALKMGFLSIPPQHFLRKAWLKRYCALYNASNHGIQRIEIFETEDAYVKQSPSKIIPLTDCWKVTPLPQKHQPNVFEVRTKSNSYQFSADTFQEMSEWIVSLQTVAFNKTQFKASSTSVPTSDEKQEENLLYCSMDEPEVYLVKAVPTEAVLRNNLQGEYKLIITSVNFSLSEESSQGRIGKVILTWPYRHIRRYGCGPDTFSFEAGRKCSSGEGLFTFSTSEGSKIFQSIDGHVSALKSTQGEIPNSPSVKEDKNNCFTSKDSLNSNELASDQTISQSDQSFTSDVNYVAAINFKSSFKSTPPFKKPPRKTKSNFYDQCSDNTSMVSKMHHQDSPNEYAEISRRYSSDTLLKSPKMSHVINNSLKYSDELCNIPQQSFQAKVGNVTNSSQITDKGELSSRIEELRLAETQIKDMTVKRTGSNLDYENCGPAFEIASQFSRSTYAAEHIYGKLSNARQSAPSSTGSVYGSIMSNAKAGGDISPVYSNVPYLKQSKSSITGETENEPDHFLKNDAEYAQVLKKNKNTS